MEKEPDTKPKKKAVLFTKEYLDNHPHARWLNQAIRSNRWGKDKNVTITYRKDDGSVSERKVKPILAKKHLLLAHDHSKNALRSFHIGKIEKMEKTAFELGFEKQAGLFRRIGKTKAFIVGTPQSSVRKESDHLLRLALRQPVVDKPMRWLAHHYGQSLGSVRDQVFESLNNNDRLIGGTVAGGKSYIGRHFIQQAGMPLRDVVNHELFHTKPIIGHSEILAHIAGGLRSKKGTLSPGQAVKDLGMLAHARPGRAAIELGVGTGLAVGATKGTKKVYNSLTEDKGKPLAPKGVSFEA